MSMNIENKVVLVTGANRGIGKSIVETFIERGIAKVYAAVRNAGSANSLVAAHSDKVVPIQVDLGKPETIAAAAKQATDVNIVVNNAGVLYNASPLSEDACTVLLQEMNINVGGLIRIAQTFAPVLKANGGGALVQLNSVASMKNFSDFATYSASKAAAYSITQGLREKLEEQATAVVSVHPGPIATDMATSAGFGDIAEPASVVADGIINALENGHFHVFPDSMAKQIWQHYEVFATNIVEANLLEG